MHTDNYCNNCGKPGHSYIQCKIPITSNGIIVFRMNQATPEYLMIRRKDSLGYVDFMRGKYSVSNKHYILNMLKQMTAEEKMRLIHHEFDELWNNLWLGSKHISNQYKNEETASRMNLSLLKKGVMVNGEFYQLTQLIEESMQFHTWEETEWGFPKGRRNYQEKDFDCAMREFHEETGYSYQFLKNVQNILPYEEIFTGSNYKSYKHKYYLMYMSFADSIKPTDYDVTEVSKLEWKTYEDCVNCIREYNKEKIAMLTRIHKTLTNYMLFYI
jgi:8-oxo-dGTP pyrophosphatase MutT (NUDIX family)